MTELNMAMRQHLARESIQSMLLGNHFDICAVRRCLDLVRLKVDSDLMLALEVLHCIHYGAMSPTTRQFVFDTMRDWFGDEVMTIAPLARSQPASRSTADKSGGFFAFLRGVKS